MRLKIILCGLWLLPFLAMCQLHPPAKGSCAPVLLLNGYKSGDAISKKDLATLKELSVYYPCTNEFSRRIIGYMVTVTKGRSNTGAHSFTHLLSSSALSALIMADVGSVIFIDYVVIRKKDLSTHNIAGMTLHVTADKSSVPMTINTTAKIPSCDPIFYLGQFKNGSTITKNQLNLIKSASVGNTCNLGKKVGGCWADVPYKSVSYKVSTKVNDVTWSTTSSTYEFPQQVREQFRAMKDSAQLFVSEIKATYEDGSIVEIPATMYKVVPAPKAAKEGVNNTVRGPRKK